MDEFLQLAQNQLGLGQEITRSAAGSLLKVIGDQADGADYQALLDKVPGAQELAKAAPSAAEGASGGGLSGLMSQGAAALGGKFGSALGVAAALKGAGLNTDQFAPFVTLFTQFCQQKAGSDLMGRVLGAVPDLKKMVAS